MSCWAHARRKFVDCEKDYPIECNEFLEKIRALYRIEEQVPDPWTLRGDERESAFAMLAVLRKKESKAVTDDIKAWALEKTALRKSSLRRQPAAS